MNWRDRDERLGWIAQCSPSAKADMGIGSMCRNVRLQKKERESRKDGTNIKSYLQSKLKLYLTPTIWAPTSHSPHQANLTLTYLVSFPILAHYYYPLAQLLCNRKLKGFHLLKKKKNGKVFTHSISKRPHDYCKRNFYLVNY